MLVDQVPTGRSPALPRIGDLSSLWTGLQHEGDMGDMWLAQARRLREKLAETGRGARLSVIDDWAARSGISASRMRAHLAVAEWVDSLPLPPSERKKIERLDFVRAQLFRKLGAVNPEEAWQLFFSSPEDLPSAAELRLMISSMRGDESSGDRATLLSTLRAADETACALVPGPRTAGRRPPFCLRRRNKWVEADAFWRRRKVACLLSPLDSGRAAAVAIDVRAGSVSSLQNRVAFLRLTAHALTSVAFEVLVVADSAEAGRLIEDLDLGTTFDVTAAEIWVYHAPGSDGRARETISF